MTKHLGAVQASFNSRAADIMIQSIGKCMDTLCKKHVKAVRLKAVGEPGLSLLEPFLPLPLLLPVLHGLFSSILVISLYFLKACVGCVLDVYSLFSAMT